MKSDNKNKLLRNVDPITWHQLKIMAAKREITIAEMIKFITEFFLSKNEGEL